MNQTNRRDPWNILLLLGSILALLISFIGATGTILLGVVGFFVGGSISNNAAWVLAGTFIGLAFISLPSGWVAIQALQGNAQEVRKPSPRTIQIILMMFPFVLLLGTLAFQEDILPSFLGPPAHLFAALLPVIALAALILRRGPKISQRRGWAHFMAGLWISPITALVFELLAAIPLILIFIAGINASLGQDFLLGLLQNPEVFPDEASVQDLIEVLSQPVYISLVVAYLGIFVPIIEELIKAIGIVPLIWRRISSVEGFLGGALAGAGYGLFEALYLGQPGPGWAALMLARGGATMMHMLTAGLTGIGIARAKEAKSVMVFLRYYFSAVALHALWNFAAVMMGIGMASEALPNANIQPALGNALAVGGGVVLVIMSLVAFQGLRRYSTEPGEDVSVSIGASSD